MKKIDIYCPVCAEQRHKKKKLLEVDKSAKGVIYPFCKLCHANVKIDLDKLSAESRNS